MIIARREKTCVIRKGDWQKSHGLSARWLAPQAVGKSPYRLDTPSKVTWCTVRNKLPYLPTLSSRSIHRGFPPLHMSDGDNG
jgi:hypothetical protein